MVPPACNPHDKERAFVPQPSPPKKHRRRTATPVPDADARSAALGVLERLEGGKTTLDALLDDTLPMRDALGRRDRALFNQLVYGVLRWRMRLDAVIGVQADRPLHKIATTVRNILRLALFQIQFMDRIPPSAAVNTAVNLARSHGVAKAAGFINALLRNHLRDPGSFCLPDAQAAPVDHLAVSASLPRWLAERWIGRFGADGARALGNAINTIPSITLRCNGLKNTMDELMAALTDEADTVEALAALPGAVRLVAPRRPIARMQAFADGRFAVQDGAAQLVSLLLAPRPGETVLDACAGLGGKTGHLAQLMENRGRLVALDSIGAKLARLEGEMQRLGAAIVHARQMDLNHAPAPDALPRFDRILLDAPCSGLGVLRRNPDAKWAAQKQGIARFAKRQLRFLTHLAPLLKPGGTLVFSVCSMESEENEAVIERFLKNHPNFVIDSLESTENRCVRPYLDADGFFRTFPHVHKLDGFFAARLHRTR